MEAALFDSCIQKSKSVFFDTQQKDSFLLLVTRKPGRVWLRKPRSEGDSVLPSPGVLRLVVLPAG